MSADAVVTFAIPAHLTPGQHDTLLQRVALQSHARATFWRLVRAGLGASDVEMKWPVPKVDRHEMKEALAALTAVDDLAGQNYVERVSSAEMRRLRALPARVGWDELQAAPEREEVVLPNRPVVVGGDQLVLPDLVIDVDAFTLPDPFRAAVLVPGAERLTKWRHELEADLGRWGNLNLSDKARTRIQRHVEQYAPWCTGEAVVAPAVPGVCAVRASLLRRPGRDGVRRWNCCLTFTVTPAAIKQWMPEVTNEGPIGIDPGMRHPFTCESVTAVRSSPQPLINFSGLPGLAGHGSGARALRRACWSRHESDYRQAWQQVLEHRLIRIENTNWRPVVKSSETFAAFVSAARTNFMWVWLDHLAALASLGGQSIELVPPDFTSRTCSACKRLAPKRQQRWFVCSRCKFRAPVDVNAARNIRLGGCPRPSST